MDIVFAFRGLISVVLLGLCVTAMAETAVRAERIARPIVEVETTGSTEEPFECEQRGSWYIARTANFFVCSDQSREQAVELGRAAEALRDEMRRRWLGEFDDEPWSPRCRLVLHRTRQGYVSAAGRGSEATVGSSLVTVEAGRITGRRIDLLCGGRSPSSSALPHELTHVVLRERFVAAGVPRWADEGAAVLADSLVKRSLHRADLETAFTRRATFHAAELLIVDGYPPAERWGTFYGQSASLVEFLIERRTPARFVEFLQQAGDEGYDAALDRCYDIADVDELDRVWRRHVAAAVGTSRTAPVRGATIP